MWFALDYCMCPAKIWVEWCKEIVDGFYIAKVKIRNLSIIILLVNNL